MNTQSTRETLCISATPTAEEIARNADDLHEAHRVLRSIVLMLAMAGAAAILVTIAFWR